MINSALRRASLLVLAVAGLALAAPSIAGANPACGSHVTHSVTLTADMTCTTSDGIDVGKSGITINLNGHTITGPMGSPSYKGVNDSGYARVTIENGRVRNFAYGVYVVVSMGSKVLNINAHGAAGAGIFYAESRDGVIDHSGAFGNPTYGIELSQNTNVNVTNSKTNKNGYGLTDANSAAKLNHVTSSYNSVYGFRIDSPAVTSSGPYTIENSTADHNGGSNGGSGVYILSNSPQWQYQADLIGNTANDNADYGFYAQYWANGSNNHATGNGIQNCSKVPGCS